MGTASERNEVRLGVWWLGSSRVTRQLRLPVWEMFPPLGLRWLRKQPNTRQGEVIRRGAAELLEKAIANRTKRAHGKPMHNNGVGAELFAKGIPA